MGRIEQIVNVKENTISMGKNVLHIIRNVRLNTKLFT